MRPDAVTLLRDLRPPDPPRGPDEAALDRIFATPPGEPPRRRRRALRPALVASAALLGAVAVVPGGSPDVLARTAAALSDEDTILHFRAEVRHRSHGAELQANEPDAEVDAWLENWQTAGGRRERVLFDGAVEFVKDWDARVSESYVPARDELIRHTDPDVFSEDAGPHTLGSSTPFGGTAVGDLTRLMDRARRGEADVSLVGETTVRGVEVYELRVDLDAGQFAVAPRPDGSPGEPVTASRTIYVDRERFLPVRVEMRTNGIVGEVIDFVMVERLPRTPENERLLEMSPHPGAKVIVEDRG